jgi:hypothetical protein
VLGKEFLVSNTRRRKGLAWLAVLALGAAMSVTQVTPGMAVDPPGTVDEGQLRLHMSTDGNRFSYTPFGGTPVATQPISQSSKCGYNSGTNLVSVLAGGGSVGFSTSNAQLGVDSRDGASKCTQANPGESLTLDITNGPGSTMAGLYATHATLDLELKFSPSVTIRAYKDGGSTPVLTETFDCTVSDCGPDRSVDGDNIYRRFPSAGTVLFDKITITAASTGSSTGSAGVSLEGGHDLYSTPQDSIFFMGAAAEQLLCPGDSISEPTGAGTATVTYLGTPDPDCADPKAALLAYTRDATTNDRQLTFLTGDGPSAMFDVFIPWDPEIATNPVFLSDTNPAGDDGNPAGEWCDGGPLSNPPDPATDFQMPAGESWCAYSLQAEPVGGGNIQVTERWLLNQDANLRR